MGPKLGVPRKTGRILPRDAIPNVLAGRGDTSPSCFTFDVTSLFCTAYPDACIIPWAYRDPLMMNKAPFDLVLYPGETRLTYGFADIVCTRGHHIGKRMTKNEKLYSRWPVG